MDFFEKIGTNLSKKGKDVAKKAKDLSEIVKLNSKISSCEETINSAYQHIGKKFYEASKTEPADEYKNLYQSIEDAYTTIAQCQEEIKTLKGLDSCVSCGAAIPDNATFCPSCGAKQEVEVETEIVPDSTDIFCINCGSPMTSDTFICPSCGTKKEEITEEI